MQNAGHPPPIYGGGTVANNTFQKIVMKCIAASVPVTSSMIISSSSILGPSITAFLNYYDQDGSREFMKYSIILACSAAPASYSSFWLMVIKQTFFLDILTDFGSAFSSLTLNITASFSLSSPYSSYSSSILVFPMVLLST